MTEELKCPRWVREKDDCIFCGRFATFSNIEIKGNNVAISYPCRNEECSYLRFNRGNYVSVLIYENSLERYEEFLTAPPSGSAQLNPEVPDLVT